MRDLDVGCQQSTGAPPQITGLIDCSDPHEQGKVVNASSDGTCPPNAAQFGIINSAGNLTHQVCIDPSQ